MNWLMVRRSHLDRIRNNIIPADVDSFGLCTDCLLKGEVDPCVYERYGLCMKPCHKCGKEA